MRNIGFIVEQGLGHRTHSLNLQSNVAKDKSIHAIWRLMEPQKGLSAKLPFFGRYWTLEAGLRTRRMIGEIQRHTQLDALFFHTQVMAVLATNWVKRIPSVISLDATPLQYDAFGEFYEHRRAPEWIERRKWQLNYNCFHHARHLITWSQWAKQGLIDDYQVPTEKITVIPPGINIQEWVRPTLRTEQKGPVKILFVGGNLKRKGGLLLLQAFRLLRCQRHGAGAGNEHGVELHLVTRDQVPPEPGVFVYQNMEPNSPALKTLFHTCDLFCLPTYGDCLPITLVEAGAAGLPCVTTNIGGSGEIVEDQKTGFLTPVGDAKALTECLDELIQRPDLRLQQGLNAVSTISQRCDAEQNTFQLLELLKRAIGRANAN